MPFLPLAHHRQKFALTLASSLLLSSVLVSSNTTYTQATALPKLFFSAVGFLSDSADLGERILDFMSSYPEEGSIVIQQYTDIIQNKILDLNDLSTFLVNYSGIATVYDSKKPTNISYHVSYEASVKLGLNFNDITVNLNLENQQLEITLPNIKVTDTEVYFPSLDFMFMDSKSNTPTVASEAYQVCINDIKYKSLQFTTERELATENAKNIIQGLMYPFLQQLGSEFTLIFL